MNSTKISVIIPTYNEEGYIYSCLNSLSKQSYKNLEVIVVDDGSTDKTRDIVKKFKKVKLIAGEHKGPGFSRNLGAKKAKGSILIFIDADMVFDNDYITNLVKPIFEGKTYGTAHGVEYALNMNNIWARCWGRTRVDPSVKEHAIFRAIKKGVFFEKGGFDPKYGYADDQTFFLKYGMKSLAVPSAISYHRNAETLKEVYKQSRWIGASIDNFWIRNKIFKYFIPPIMILFSPIIIPILAVRKTFLNKDIIVFFPMFIFMIFRYFGTINGLFRKVYFNINVR